MNIKRAKEEIKNTIEAYLLKNEYGAYQIPAIHQRPVLLIGPPGVGKTQIMEQISQETERHWPALYSGEDLFRHTDVGYRIYHE